MTTIVKLPPCSSVSVLSFHAASHDLPAAAAQHAGRARVRIMTPADLRRVAAIAAETQPGQGVYVYPAVDAFVVNSYAYPARVQRAVVLGRRAGGAWIAFQWARAQRPNGRGPAETSMGRVMTANARTWLASELMRQRHDLA